jgi:hypothetical protein
VRHPILSVGASVAVAAGLALSACGSSSSPTPTPKAAVGNNSSAFCTQAGVVVAGFANLGTTLAPTSPGAVPNLTSIKQVIATGAAALDSLDSAAPSEIASAFHTFRTAYDQANSAAQAATTIDQFTNVFAPFNTPAVTAASTRIESYLATKCGITPSASSAAATPSPT